MAKSVLCGKWIFSCLALWLFIYLHYLNLNNTYLLIFIPAFVFIYWVFVHSKDLEIINKYISYAIACLLALVTVAEVMMQFRLTLSRIIAYVIMFFGFIFLFENIIQLIFSIPLSKYFFQQKDQESLSWGKIFLFIFLLWIAYLIPYLPGNIAGDGNFQLTQFFGYASMTNHHPFLTTMFEGGLVKIGNELVNANFGLFLYVIVQMIICCLIYSYCISFFSNLGLSKKITISLIILVGILPFWSLVSETLHKDGMFIAFFTLFVVLLIDKILRLRDKVKNFSTINLAMLIISALLVCFWRNDGIYIVFPSIFCLIFIDNRKYWKEFSVVLLIVLGIYVGFNKIILPSLNVAPTEKREALSLPVQQTARYIKNYPNDISETDRKVLNSSFNNYKKLGKVYNPVDADATKFRLKDKFNVIEYLHTWLHMGLRHPLTYIKATYAGSSDYYTPWIKSGDFEWCASMASWSKPTFIHFSYIFSNEFRNKVITVIFKICSFPLINVLMNSALAVWICIMLFAVLWSEYGFCSVIPTIPIFMNLLICIASPVNGLTRYSGCVVLATYFLVIYFLYIIKMKGEK